MANLESFEKCATQCQRNSGKVLTDSPRIGIALNRLRDSEMPAHLLHNAARLKDWKNFRNEIINVAKAKAAAQGRLGTLMRQTDDGGVRPMDVGAVSRYGK